MDGNVPSDMEESAREILGKRMDNCYKRIIRLEVKADKYDQKLLVLTDYRIFILSAKVPTKIEHNIHYLDLQCIESKKANQMVVVTDGKRLSLSVPEPGDVDQMIVYITGVIRNAFPTQLVQQVVKMDLAPLERQKRLCENPRDSFLRDVGPCGGFSAIYAALCDHINLPFLEEVAWDVDTIYLSQDSKELNLGDFDHLGIKHLVPIISALQYNTWFTSLNANNIKLTTEAANEVLQVIRRNNHLEELHLRNIGAKWEFAHRLAMALLHNTKSQLTTLDLSENPIEDRGMNHLCTPISKLQRGLKHLNLSRTGITSKGINRLAESLHANKTIPTTLQVLDLSDNILKNEDISNLNNFFAQPNAITQLRLSGTECALENLFGALLPGCCKHLTHLDLSHNVFSHRRTKHESIPYTWNQFFASASALKVVNMTDCRLSADALKSVLLGVLVNPDVKDLDLDVSSNNLRAAGADILENVLPEIGNLATFNMSDNGFDNDISRICNKMSLNRSIKTLSMGRNFNNIKPKNLANVLDSLVQMIQDENSVIESLSLADSRLKNDTAIIINALGSNSSLSEIDISGNLMGDVGVRMLAKALQINTRIHTIYWDRNGTTASGFTDLAQGLSKNYSVKKMPLPITDAALALRLNAEKTERALQKIEDLLKRNHSPRKLATDQGYRLHQGFLISSSQQMLVRLVGQVQEHITTLEKGGRNLTEDAKTDIRHAARLVADANATKHILPKLEQVALQVETEGNLIDTKLGTVSSDLQTAMQTQLKRTVSDMMKSVEHQCPTVMEDADIRLSLDTSSTEKCSLPPGFTQTLLIDHVGADIMNKVSELNLAVASHISDRLIDGILDALDAVHRKLTNHINNVDSVTAAASETFIPKQTRPDNLPPKEKPKSQKALNEDLFDEVAAQSTIKRKSLYSRRLRPQSVIDPNDVKKALKMHEVESKGAGPVAEEEEEHDNEGDHGMMEQEQVAVATMNAVAETTLDVVVSAEKEVEGIDVVIETVVDDSQALKDQRDGKAVLQAPLVAGPERVCPHHVVDVAGSEKVVLAAAACEVFLEAKPETESESDVMTSDSESKKSEGKDSSSSRSEESRTSSDTEILEDAESKQKQEPEIKSDPNSEKPSPPATPPPSADDANAEAEPRVKTPEPKPRLKKLLKKRLEPVVRPEPAIKIELDTPAEPEAIAEPKNKVILKPKPVVRPESKVASRMNPGFLADLAAGLGKAGRKEKSEGKEGKEKGDETDSKASGDEAEGARGNKDLSPIPQSPSTPKSPSLSLRSASSVSDVSLPPLEELPKLEHLQKSRPRRNKTRAASRAVVKSDTSIDDIQEIVDSGIDEFFERKEVKKEFIEHEGEEKEKGDEEKKDDPKKKGWSPFPNQGNAKGLAAGITSFFARRDKPSPSRSPESARKLVPTEEEPVKKSPEPTRRSLPKSPTPDKKKTAEKETEKAKAEHPSPSPREEKKEGETKETPSVKRGGVGMPGLPITSQGGASALLADLRAKRTTMKPPSPTSTKGDDKENKENKENNRASIIPPSKENRNSIHPPPSAKDRTSVGVTPALRQAPGQSATRPVPAPRSSSPATLGDKSIDKSDDSTSSASPPSKNRPLIPARPRPPPIAPKPRSKPSPTSTSSSSSSSNVLPASSSAKPTIITTPRTSALTGRISESIGERASPPTSASSSDKEDKDSDTPPPQKTDRARRRLSVKEKVAFLDKNSNEQSSDQLSSRRASNLPKDQTSPKVSDGLPQRARSMYVGNIGDNPLLRSPLLGQRREMQKDNGEEEKGTETPNGAANKESEFVLFL